MKIESGSVVYIWPGIEVCVTRLPGDQRTPKEFSGMYFIQFFNHKHELWGRWIKEEKILGVKP